MKKLNIFAFTVLMLVGCSVDKGYQQSIQGTWQGVSWMVEDQDNRDATTVKFHFDGENYDAVLGGREEKGSFRVQGVKLYTLAEGQQEIMVKIARLTTDTLEFEMNRGGVKENLILKKE
ncbi:MAG: hypothetical protein IPM82_13680 [Saprospiraceae bacterium]|nr:hypothetical protein [Saprospiraceae bacterium]